MGDDLIKRLRELAARKWPDAPNQTHSLFGQAAAALEAQAKRIAELESALQSEKDEVFRLQCSHSALYARVQELEADAARWRWAKQHFRVFSLNIDGQHQYAPNAPFGYVRGPTIDAAIDAALKEKQP